MKLSWRDIVGALLTVAGGVVVFAKLQAYSWPFLGSWKGALGVVTVIGSIILATYLIDWFRDTAVEAVSEMFVWVAAATIVVGSLFATTTKVEFVWSASVIGLAWLMQLGAHIWESLHQHPTHYAHVH